MAAFSAGRAQMGARCWGGVGTGDTNCSATFCEFEQLNVLAAMTTTARRRIWNPPKPPQSHPPLCALIQIKQEKGAVGWEAAPESQTRRKPCATVSTPA
jgi:hypothetical protein